MPRPSWTAGVYDWSSQKPLLATIDCLLLEVVLAAATRWLEAHVKFAVDTVNQDLTAFLGSFHLPFSTQHLLPLHAFLPPQAYQVSLLTLLPRRIRFDAMHLLKQLFHSHLQMLVLHALVEFTQEMPSCDKRIVREREGRVAKVLLACILVSLG
jgi:hypothetical protein